MALIERLRYPKSRHRRKEKPGLFKDYQTYKSYLRREFDRTCVYCRSFDGIRSESEFAVEHYLPKTLHPELECSYRNLFYACLRCNSLKSTWPYVRVGGKWQKVSQTILN